MTMLEALQLCHILIEEKIGGLQMMQIDPQFEECFELITTQIGQLSRQREDVKLLVDAIIARSLD